MGFKGKNGLADHSTDYDKDSIIVVCYHKGSPIGTIRLIDYKNCSLLDLYNISLPSNVDEASIFELSGLAVKFSHLGKGRIVMLGLIDKAFSVTNKSKRKWLICVASKNNSKLFKSINNDCSELQQLDPDAKHLENRQNKFEQWFKRFGCSSRILLFGLDRVSYPSFILSILLQQILNSTFIKNTIQNMSFKKEPLRS
ncbi:MAG: hypothetical protein OCD76_09145 [Reichenbachiella sp.]